MATSGDIRDIMDLGHDGPRQSLPKKKKKALEMQPRLSGMSREVQALMGDSVPPVAIVEAPKYKQKPSVAMRMFKPRHWEEKSFTHGARNDALQLKHWKRSIPGSQIRPSAPTPLPHESTDVEMTDGHEQDSALVEMRFEDEFPSEKWNVEIPVPKYTDEQYEKHLKSEEWTKEETDYLMHICHNYDLRWILVADRYDPSEVTSTTTDNALKPAYPARRMEDLKQRYYTVAAKILEIQTPASNMTQLEFQLWEKMRNFDARTEAQRKSMAEKLFERTKEEADEEKILLEELFRITKNEEDFIKMRKELYSRLETAPSLRRNERGEEPSTAIYQTSQGLSMLLSGLLAKEKRLKSRIVPNGTEAAQASQTPADTQKSRHSAQYSRRETMDSTAGDDNGPPTKKGSISQTPVVRTLTPAEEVKFGVSHPQERLTYGVMFRHEKINRLTMAKSQVQTQKIGAALTELGIPPRLLMPTERVCREFERLVGEVQILLDTRRVLEKVSSEVKVLEEHKQLRMGGAQDAADGSEEKTENGAIMQVDGSTSAPDQQSKLSEATDKTGALPKDPKLEAKEQNGVISAQDNDDDETQENARPEVDDSQVQDDDDEDGENTNDRSVMADDDEDNDDVDRSYAQQDEEDEDEDGEDDQDDDNDVAVDDDDDDEDEDDDDAPGLEDLERAHQITDDEDGDDDNEIDPSQLADNDDEEDDDEEGEEEDNVDEDENADAEVDESMMNGADEEDEDQEGAEVEDEQGNGGSNKPLSPHLNVRGHKRSASVLSDASRAGSNRSGVGRKKAR